MNKLIFSALAGVTLSLFLASGSYASYGAEACQPIYGGGQTCVTAGKILIDKKILHPTQKTKGGDLSTFVDNLSINDPKYSPLQTVKFQLVVTNTGDSTLSEVKVTDILPAYVNFVAGPGNFDASNRTLTFNIVNLNPNESRKFTIETKVVAPDSLPSGQGVVCVVNQASALFDSEESKDNSQFCIERKVTTKGGLPVVETPKGITQTPATGPELLSLIGLIPAGAAGLFLRRKASK